VSDILFFEVFWWFSTEKYGGEGVWS